MEWTQTLTIIFTIISSMIAVWYAFYHIIKEDIKRHDVEFQEVRSEFSKVHGLWANILERIDHRNEQFYSLEKQIYEIKLDQSRKT